MNANTWAAIRAGKAPKPEFAALVENLNGVLITSEGGPAFLRSYPTLGAAVAALRQRKNIDALYVSSEDLGLIAAPLLRAFGWRRPIVVVVHAALSPRMQKILRLIGRLTFTNAICVSEAQRKILISDCKFAESQAVHAFNWVDTDFFSPGGQSGEFAFACGLENRDYTTLFRAASLTDKAFVVCAGGFHGRDRTLTESAPPNVTIISERLSWAELRDRYRQARLVIVPLNDVGYAAGVTSLVEAGATGKPAIKTDSRGVTEYPSTAKVKPSDPESLAAEVDRLWLDVDSAEKAGRQAREWAIKHASLTRYVERIAQLAFHSGGSEGRH